MRHQPAQATRWAQGHALFTRQAGGKNPCPLVNFTAFDQ